MVSSPLSGGWKRRCWKTQNKVKLFHSSVRKGCISYIWTTEVSHFWGMAVLCLPDLKSSTIDASGIIWSICRSLFPGSNTCWKPNGCSVRAGEEFCLLRDFLKKELLGRPEGTSSLISPQHCKLLALALVLWQLSLWVWWSSCYTSNFCRLLLLGLSSTRQAALQCQEKEDYEEQKKRLAIARKPASPFTRKRCLTCSILCDHLLHTGLLVNLLCGQRMSASEVRADTALYLLPSFASLLSASHTASLKPGSPFSSNFCHSTADSNTCSTFLAWIATGRGNAACTQHVMATQMVKHQRSSGPWVYQVTVLAYWRHAKTFQSYGPRVKRNYTSWTSYKNFLKCNFYLISIKQELSNS